MLREELWYTLHERSRNSEKIPVTSIRTCYAITICTCIVEKCNQMQVLCTGTWYRASCVCRHNFDGNYYKRFLSTHHVCSIMIILVPSHCLALTLSSLHTHNTHSPSLSMSTHPKQCTQSSLYLLGCKQGVNEVIDSR